MEFSHKSVLLDEAIDSLRIKPDGIYIDGTAGGAGHSTEIAKRLSSGKLVAIDRDPDAVRVATERLAGLNATVVQGNFTEMGEIAERLGISQVDGVLLDLGTSSWQLDNAARGFSYHKDALLDMRMSQSGATASELVNNLSLNALTEILRNYGEEKFAGRIAASIVKQRQIKRIETTIELAEIVSNSVPAAAKRDGHPARKTFQAIRIAVNDELKAIEEGIDTAFGLLAVGGILSVITFHSLEDRIVKHRFAEFCRGCTCPPDFPICVCKNKPRARLVNRKPIIPDRQETEENPRSRSAKLRCVMKI